MSPTTEVFEGRRVLFLSDLVGFARLVSSWPDRRTYELLVAVAQTVSDRIEAAGGRVIKVLGDGCLAVFEPDGGPAAVAVAEALQADLEVLGRKLCGRPLVCGINLHCGRMVEGPLGPRGQSDIVGQAVNHVFLMGGGAGLRISEPVFRQLANADRGRWSKRKPPAVYTLGG